MTKREPQISIINFLEETGCSITQVFRLSKEIKKMKKEFEKNGFLTMVNVNGYVSESWWRKYYQLHGKQIDECCYMVDWKISMLIQRIFILIKNSCGEEHLPEGEIIDLGWVRIDTKTPWEKVNEKLNTITASTEDELLHLVKFLEQTVVWVGEGPLDGWYTLDKNRKMYKVWDFYYSFPEMISLYLDGYVYSPLSQDGEYISSNGG